MEKNNAYKRGLYSSLMRVAANVLMLAALCLGMYQAGQHPEATLLVFSQWFFGITVPAWAAVIYGNKLLRRAFPTEYDNATWVKLPRVGEIRVVWEVAAERRLAR